MRTRTSRTGNKGFTLIELIVVLVIIGIAASVVFIAASNAYRKSVLRYEVRKVYSALNYSRELSITRHTLLTFAAYEDSSGYTVTSNEKSIFARTLPGGISISADTIEFYPLGDSSGGSLSITDEQGRKYEIEVSNITGKAKVQRFQPS